MARSLCTAVSVKKACLRNGAFQAFTFARRQTFMVNVGFVLGRRKGVVQPAHELVPARGTSDVLVSVLQPVLAEEVLPSFLA